MCSSAAHAAGIGKTALVVGPGMEEVAQAATALDPKLEVFVQPEQQGTADAVKAARQAFEDFKGHVLILYGDTPLLRPETLKAVAAELSSGADLVVDRLRGREPDRLRTSAARRQGTARSHPRGEGRER